MTNRDLVYNDLTYALAPEQAQRLKSVTELTMPRGVRLPYIVVEAALWRKNVKIGRASE